MKAILSIILFGTALLGISVVHAQANGGLVPLEKPYWDPFAIPLYPGVAPGSESAKQIEAWASGKRVLVSILRGGDLVVLDTSTRKELKRMSLGKGAAGIAMDPNGSRAFVACTADDYVAVINLKSLAVVNRLSVGGAPDGMTFTIRP